MYRALVFLSILLVLGVPRVDAQTAYAIDAGSFIANGSVSFTSVGGDDIQDRVTLVSINPVLQYFPVAHLAVGGAFGFSYASGSDQENRASSHSIGVGPRVGYYFGTANSRVYPFLAGTLFVTRAILGAIELPQVGTLDPPDRTTLDLQPSAGAAFMISRNVAITGEAFYRVNFIEVDGENERTDMNEFGFRFGLAAFVY